MTADLIHFSLEINLTCSRCPCGLIAPYIWFIFIYFLFSSINLLFFQCHTWHVHCMRTMRPSTTPQMFQIANSRPELPGSHWLIGEENKLTRTRKPDWRHNIYGKPLISFLFHGGIKLTSGCRLPVMDDVRLPLTAPQRHRLVTESMPQAASHWLEHKSGGGQGCRAGGPRPPLKKCPNKVSS